MTFYTTGKQVVVTLFGLANASVGGFFLWLEMQKPSVHPTLVYLFAGWIAVGMLIAWPSVFLNAVKQVVALLPSIKIGGTGGAP